ncbi:MAG: membrane protein FxsA [Halodesulfurarchaeum sp.]|nr:membrane protein FxsA [Halodesulfurarchaeum sp.]
MLRWLLIALLLIPLADIALLVVVAGAIGWVPTVALVVLTALLGMLFVRAEGRHTLRRIQQSLAQGDLPTNQVVDGGLLIAAGAFLLTPGLVTDAVGFLLALPLTRIPIRILLKRYVITPVLEKKTGGFATGNVYTAGFPGSNGPNEGATGPGGPGAPGPDSGTGRSSGGATVDLGPDEYDVSSGNDEE